MVNQTPVAPAAADTPVAPGTASPPFQEEAGVDAFPLSFAQQRLWFLHRLDPRSAAYNVPLTFRGTAELRPEVLRRSLGTLVERHEALRTTFRELDGEPVQVVNDLVPEHFREVDLRGSTGDREREFLRLAEAEADRPFDLETGPLLRTLVVRLEEREWGIVLAFHHVVTDGWSISILLRELAELYAAHAAGHEPALPWPELQYADFAVWQRDALQGAALERETAFWRERLESAPRLLDLPTDRPRPAVAGWKGAGHRFTLPAETVGPLRELALAERGTLYMTLLAGWQLLLSRYSGQDDLLVGTPIAGRTRPELEGVVGFFVNTLVVRARLSGALTFRGLLRQVREFMLDAYAHQDLPLEKLVEELGVERTLAHTPLFQTLFTFQNTERTGLTLGGARFEAVQTGTRTSKFDLELAAGELDGGVTGALAFRTDLFDRATAERMTEHYAALLRAVAANPDLPLERVSLLGDDERRRILEEWGPSPREAAEPPVHALFAAQAARTPAAAALRWRGETLAYGELERRANRLANHLRGLGVGPEQCVGVFMERTPELVVALLGVLKAGGAYVPLDPVYPRGRLGYMAEDAGVRLALTTAPLSGRLPDGVEPVCLDRLDERLATAADRAPESGAGPENLSHVIFTSGSTGRPKGVMIRHRSTTALLHWLRGEIRDEERRAVLGSTSINFDVSVAEIFGTLCWGGTLVLVENALELPSVAGEEVRSASMVPTAAAELLRTGGIPASVRTLNLGGEALPDDLARALHALGTVDTLRNLYGPTEDTTYSTRAVVPPGADGVRIGRPVAGARAYVLDGALQPVPAGVPGELYLAGDGVARGYAARPGLTAESFLPDPFGAAGGRMYRVRDRARWTAEGELEYLGRTDLQVKVRGFRVELGEIEAALRAHPALRDAAAAVREDDPGDPRLVAYVVAAEGAEVPAAAVLRAALRERLPEHMVPSAFVALDTLPTTPNGKVDRRALPAPAPAAAEPAVAEDDAPRTPEEEVVAGIFADVLRVERVGRTADFFELGGHSLLATRVVARVREALGVELPLRALFEAPTAESAAARVEAMLRDGTEARVPPLLPVERTGPLPLSFAQQRLWFIQQVEPESAAYNMPFALRLRGALRVEALAGSLAVVAARHETLRTRFPTVDGTPAQVVEPAAPVPLPTVDLSHLAEEDREGALARLAAEEAARPFDLARGPVLRSTLVRLAADEHALLLTLHHVVCDGWSLGVLTRELSEAYAACAEGRTPALPALPVQYADYAAWQRSWLAGEVLEGQLAYWRERLAGAPPLLELPTDRPRPAWPGGEGARCGFRLPPDTSRALAELSRREGVTLFMTVLAAFQLLLARYSGEEDVVVGTPIANRARLETEPLIGFFANTLVLRNDVGGDPTFRELLGRVRETTLGAYHHQDLPFERLVDELGVERGSGATPLFQAMLVLQNLELGGLRLGELEIEPIETGSATAKFDLLLALAERGGVLDGTLEYRTELFDRSTAERMLAHLGRLLDAAARDPALPVSALPMLGEGERRRVLEEWNATAAEYPAERRLHDLFAAAAARTPEARAVVWAGGALAYAELEARANRLARHLRGLGVGPDVRVGLCLERGAEMMTAVLGILKAGGACVPLDPAYPAERIEYMLADSAAPVVVTQAPLAARLPAGGARMVRLDADAGEIAGERGDPLDGGALPDHLAYVIYTSGSTGRPKGVAMPHRPLVNLLAWQAREWKAPAPAVTLQFASISFDVAFQEIFSTWAAGGALVLIDEEQRYDPAAVLETMEREGVERLFLPAVALQQLAEGATARGAAPSRLREVRTAGEQLRVTEPLRRFFAATGATLGNQYGPSETHVATAELLEGAPEAWPALPPIGRPIANARCFVVDAGGEPAPVGVPGELYLGGACLARGYLDRPGLTAERFVPDAFGGVHGARLYRTGDRVRWTADGRLEFLGRADEQVKVRGYRIEPGEVEAALLAHPAVGEAVVVAREYGPGDRRLVAYLVPAGEEDAPPAAALRAWARERLPDHMVPAAFVPLAALPLTPSGKVNRRALPAPAAGEAGGAALAPAATDTEERLAAVWQALLGVERVGRHDGFFELGGNSLLLVQLQSRIREGLGRDVPVVELLRFSTLAAQAERLDARSAEEAPPRRRRGSERAAVRRTLAGGRGRGGAENPHERSGQ